MIAMQSMEVYVSYSRFSFKLNKLFILSVQAIECLHTDVVQFLVSQQRPNVNAQDSEQNSCLHLAVYASARRLPASESATSAGSARERAFEITRLLLKADAVVDKRNRDGLTPLHIVAQLGFTDAASELLRRGANVNAVDNHRRFAPVATIHN